MKRKICYILSLIILICCCGCDDKSSVASDNRKISETEDVFIENISDKSYLYDAPNGLFGIWKVNIEDFDNEEKVELLNDICYFDFPTSLELNEDFSFMLDDETTFFRGGAILPYKDYETAVIMLLDNPYWKKADEKVYQSYLHYVDIEYQNKYLSGKSYNDCYLFYRLAGPFFAPSYGVYEQEVFIIPDKEKNLCNVYFSGVSENFTNRRGKINHD